MKIYGNLLCKRDKRNIDQKMYVTVYVSGQFNILLTSNKEIIFGLPDIATYFKASTMSLFIK